MGAGQDYTYVMIVYTVHTAVSNKGKKETPTDMTEGTTFGVCHDGYCDERRTRLIDR